MGKNYWMVVESLENHKITTQMGFTLMGFGKHQKRRVQRMQQDDRVLFYVPDLKKWTATASITSEFFTDESVVWNSSFQTDDHKYRVKLKPNIVLNEKLHIDAFILGPRLEYIKRWAPEDWPLAFLDRLHLIPQRDFRLIEGEMKRLSPRKSQKT